MTSHLPNGARPAHPTDRIADALLAELAKREVAGASMSREAAQACRAVCIDVAMKAAQLGRDIHRSTSFQEERALDGEVCTCSAIQRPPCSFCEAPSLVALAEKAFEQASTEIKRLAEEEAEEASGRG